MNPNYRGYNHNTPRNYFTPSPNQRWQRNSSFDSNYSPRPNYSPNPNYSPHTPRYGTPPFRGWGNNRRSSGYHGNKPTSQRSGVEVYYNPSMTQDPWKDLPNYKPDVSAS
ncbi:uncharacterized protein LOC100181390 [Ciona intestinalis]